MRGPPRRRTPQIRRDRPGRSAGSDKAADPLAYDNERWSDQRAQGTVDLPGFYIGKYEVTVAQFKAFADATGHRVDELALRAPANHPVTSVSWPDALAYCRWIDTKLREWPEAPPRLRELLGDGWRVQLPSEAEWEKAARGTDGRIFPGERPDATGRTTVERAR
jgi:formylglycine-generating enzyme required for sulfatase activity